jgi:iron complex outermembrane receptor protein
MARHLPLLSALIASTGLLAAQTIVLEKVEVVAPPVVSATEVDLFAEQTTTVSADQLASLNAQDIPSALRRTPGVSISRFNAVGSFGGGEGGAILLRGLGSSRPGGEIKTSVDGVPKYNAVFNHPLLDLMSIDLASEVEVSRRAAPLSTGNRFAGINLVTPRTTTPGRFARATFSFGSFSSLMEKIEAGAKVGNLDVYAGESYRASRGHRADSDGSLSNYLVKAGWKPGPRWDFTYLANRTDNRATDPGSLTATGTAHTKGDVYKTSDWLHIATAAWSDARSSGTFKAYLNDGKATWLRRLSSGNSDSLNDYRLSGLRWRDTLHPWTGGELLAGADYDVSRGRSTSIPPGGAANTTFGPASFHLFSAYAGLAQTWGAADALQITPSVGVRHYDHDRFGTAWAPQAGLLLRHRTTQVHASFGRALNFPGLDVAAFSTLAIPALGQSWQALRPERADQFEAGLRHELSPGLSVELTWFRNQGSDRYVFVPPPPPPFRYANLERFRTQGAEATLTVKASRSLSFFGGLSQLDVTPADLPYAPRTSAVSGITWRPVPAWTINIDASYTGSQHAGSQARANAATNPVVLGAFALVNSRIAYAFAWDRGLRRAELFIAGENLLNRNYRYQPGYPMPGTSASTGLTLSF